MKPIQRRRFVKQLGMLSALGRASALPLALSRPAFAQEKDAAPPDPAKAKPSAEPTVLPSPQWQIDSRERRLAWWKEAKFGMFIHWGLYSVIGQQEWVLESEGIPIPQYEIVARNFHPKRLPAREWARLAKAAGQKYMVFTTKHHEGFCMWDTKLTDYNAARQGPKRDLVREFVEAARSEGLRVGLYYSLMDWHHPDGAICARDAAARARFVDYTFGLIRELLTNYGAIDILWYDVDWPLTPRQWEAERMNKMVFDLQPNIIVNNRNGMEGDFSTPEQHVEASAAGRAWESCMTLNEGWGYQRTDTEWKSTKAILNNLARCAQQGGNYLLNIGPTPDGSVPAESVRILEETGRWLDTNGVAIYGAEGSRSAFPSFGNYDNFSRKGNKLYIHVYFWPSATPAAQWCSFFQPSVVAAVGGVLARVKSARLLKTGQPVQFEQSDISLRLYGLPSTPPDSPVTVIECECDGAPAVDHHAIRTIWKRYKVGMSS